MWNAAMDDKYFNPLSQEEIDIAEAELARERYRDDLSDEVERLRVCIEELEEALSKSIMHQKELDRCVHITAEQIDKRWKYLSEIGSKGVAKGYEQALYDLGFRRCEECDGMGNYQEIRNFNWTECESCHGHGWII